MARPLDVLVVGAGPGGIAAALTAHRRGLGVAVVDRATFPRDKTCGDGLTTGALRLLERLGVRVPAIAGFESVQETVLVSPGGRQVVLPLPDHGVHSAVVPRHDLDATLVGHARAAGVDVRDGCALTAVRHDGDAVDAELADGSRVPARFVVAADGHYSSVRRLLDGGAPVDLGTWHAARQYFTGVHDRRQWVLFEPDLLPGYAWVFPLPGGRANVGFGVLRDGRSGTALRRLWSSVLTRTSMRDVLHDATPEGTPRAWPIPAAYDREGLAHGRILSVGDAAGVVDPLTGEGIAQALETGILAVDAIVRGGGTAAVGVRYRDAVEQALGRDLRFAATLQRVLRSPWRARAAIAAAGLTPWTRRNFARWMFEDYPRALVLTPDRWRPGVFTPPGAFA
jgi:geranylgeranyl reductase family protein